MPDRLLIVSNRLDRVPVDATGWDAYRRVNQAFADTVARHWPGDLVWVHDYQLMPAPALLHERLPDARIGFFLHVPFPSSEVFRILPWRREILHGLLGADLVGFHTLGVDRLDDTEGIPRRLQAIERLLAREPDLRDTLHHVQVAVPSRGEMDRR